MRTGVVVIVVVLGMTVQLRDAATAGQEQRELDSRPLIVLTGAQSEVQEAAYHRVKSAEKLKQIWRAHVGPVQDRGDDPAPEVDFDRCMLIAVFEGASFNSHGLRVEAVVESAEVITVRFEDVSYQSSGAGNRVAPYAFVLLPKSEKPVVLQDNVQQYLGHPPVWKEVARLSWPEK